MARRLLYRAPTGGMTMSKIHWSVVPALFAAAWLTLAGATVVTVAGMPVHRSEQASTMTADSSLREDLPAILVVASR